METFNRKQHWEEIYKTKKPGEVSWFQPTPSTSLDFVKYFNIPLGAKIIDIGGGDSFFADHLLDLGYRDITVLDISESAFRRAKQRLGGRAEKVNWIVADAATFSPAMQYDFWHDRAAFHFLTEEQEIGHYIDAARQGIKPAGVLVIGTFSPDGAKKCSGIEIRQYSEETMQARVGKCFIKERCVVVDHLTPFDTVQKFIFCGFRRLADL
ncbi:MAG: class I SAM-dependent methyltransferase [Bacteroidota bacterium]